MKTLLLNHAFFPDTVSSAQHAADLAVALAASGHDVTVIASRRAYDSPKTVLPASDTWRRVNIVRVWSTGFGKRARWRRAVDFATFLLSCTLRMIRLERPDVVIAMTSPPLVSVLASAYCTLRRAALVYWVMDLNPDEAVAVGWLNAHSPITRALERLSRFSLNSATRVIALDRFMKERLLEKGVDGNKVDVLPPWAHTEHVQYNGEGRQAFRARHGLNGKFVVMHSGNHSPCHPLDTLLEAAREFKSRTDVHFCFVGGGSEMAKVRQFAAAEVLENISCLPYQPLDKVSASLSAADLHVVVMGSELVGIVHPCKVYNVLALDIPFLYIGPTPSHVSELGQATEHRHRFLAANHGDIESVVRHISSASEQHAGAPPPRSGLAEAFSQSALVPRFVSAVEDSVTRSASESRPNLLQSLSRRKRRAV